MASVRRINRSEDQYIGVSVEDIISNATHSFISGKNEAMLLRNATMSNRNPGNKYRCSTSLEIAKIDSRFPKYNAYGIPDTNLIIAAGLKKRNRAFETLLIEQKVKHIVALGNADVYEGNQDFSVVGCELIQDRLLDLTDDVTKEKIWNLAAISRTEPVLIQSSRKFCGSDEFVLMLEIIKQCNKIFLSVDADNVVNTIYRILNNIRSVKPLLVPELTGFIIAINNAYIIFQYALAHNKLKEMVDLESKAEVSVLNSPREQQRLIKTPVPDSAPLAQAVFKADAVSECSEVPSDIVMVGDEADDNLEFDDPTMVDIPSPGWSLVRANSFSFFPRVAKQQADSKSNLDVPKLTRARTV